MSKFLVYEDRWTLADGTKIHWRRDDDLGWNYKVRVFVHITDRFNVLEDLMNRRRRPYEVWRPLVLEALRQLGVEGVELRWSQNAGCSCGCSPGFIMQGGFHLGLRQGNMWITLPSAASVDDSLPARII